MGLEGEEKCGSISFFVLSVRTIFLRFFFENFVGNFLGRNFSILVQILSRLVEFHQSDACS